MASERMLCSTCRVSPVSVYCETHAIFMCTECLLGDHKGCISQVISANAALKRASEERAALLTRCQDLKDDVFQKNSRKEKLLKDHNALSEHLRTGVRHIRQSLIERINVIARNSLELVNSVMIEQKSVVENESQRLTDLKHRVDSLVSQLGEGGSRETDFTAGIESARSEISNLEAELASNSWTGGEVDVHFLVSPQVTDLMETFHSLGELLVDDTSSGHRNRYFDTFHPSTSGPDLLPTPTGPAPFRRSLIGADDGNNNVDDVVKYVFIYDTIPKPHVPKDHYASISNQLESGLSSLELPCPAPPPGVPEPEDNCPAPHVPPRIFVHPPDKTSNMASEQQEPILVTVSSQATKSSQADGEQSLPRFPNPMDLTEMQRFLRTKSSRQSGISSSKSEIVPPTQSASHMLEGTLVPKSNSTSRLNLESPSEITDPKPRTQGRPISVEGYRLHGSKEFSACYLSGLASFPDGRLLTCDFSHNMLQLISSNGTVLDQYTIRRPHGVCMIDEELFAVTSVERESVCVFKVKDNQILCQREERLTSGLVGLGLSYSKGLFAIACSNCVQMVGHNLQDVVNTIGANQNKRRTWYRKQQYLFEEASYLVVDDNGTFVSVYVSDYSKDRIFCVESNGLVKWKCSVNGPRDLCLVGGTLYVAAKKKIVVLNSDSGDVVKEIKDGVPKCPLALTYMKRWGLLVMTSFNKHKSRTQLIQSISIDP